MAVVLSSTCKFTLPAQPTPGRGLITSRSARPHVETRRLPRSPPPRAHGTELSLRFYDNFTRSLREFEPLSAGRVGLYTCGPTVYDFQHVGNFRTFLFEDVLKRAVEWNGYDVHPVMNITDVGHLVSDADEGEDKMERGSRRTGKSAWEI